MALTDRTFEAVMAELEAAYLAKLMLKPDLWAPDGEGGGGGGAGSCGHLIVRGGGEGVLPPVTCGMDTC